MVYTACEASERGVVSRLLHTAAYQSADCYTCDQGSNTDAQSCQSAMTVVWVAKRTKQETDPEGLLVLVSSVQVALEEDQLHCHICSAVHQGLGRFCWLMKAMLWLLIFLCWKAARPRSSAHAIQQGWLDVLQTSIMDK